MTKQKTKFELAWIGKDKRSRVEPCLLLENSGKSWRYLLIPHDDVVENRQLKDYR